MAARTDPEAEVVRCLRGGPVGPGAQGSRLAAMLGSRTLPGAAPTEAESVTDAGAESGADDRSAGPPPPLCSAVGGGPDGDHRLDTTDPYADQPPDRADVAPGYEYREWGDGTYPPLYCPVPVRVDEALGTEVNERLVRWAERIGLHEGRIERFRATGFGRLAMLTHPDSSDPDLLLVAAQLNAAWWACDDYYADESSLGATPTELPPRLALVLSAMDPPPGAGAYTSTLEDTIAADPVLVALRSATAHLVRHATPGQVMRVRNITSQMFVSWDAYTAWRYVGEPPPVWRYLAARQHDSFYTSMTLVDVVGGYRLGSELFADPRVHRAMMRAGTASVIVNDLYSAEREAADDQPDNLVLRIAAEEGCSPREAVERSITLHNAFVHAFEDERLALTGVPSPELHRFLLGVRAWMGGGVEWHGSSERYR